MRPHVLLAVAVLLATVTPSTWAGFSILGQGRFAFAGGTRTPAGQPRLLVFAENNRSGPLFDLAMSPFDASGTSHTVGLEAFALPSDAQFARFASLLTDGSDTVIIVSSSLPGGGGNSGGGRESALFAGQAPGVDFQGQTIDALAIRIDEAILSSPGRDPNGDGVWVDVRMSGSFFVLQGTGPFEGPLPSNPDGPPPLPPLSLGVPSPPTLVLAAAAVPALLLVARCRRRP